MTGRSPASVVTCLSTKFLTTVGSLRCTQASSDLQTRLSATTLAVTIANPWPSCDISPLPHVSTAVESEAEQGEQRNQHDASQVFEFESSTGQNSRAAAVSAFCSLPSAFAFFVSFLGFLAGVAAAAVSSCASSSLARFLVDFAAFFERLAIFQTERHC